MIESPLLLYFLPLIAGLALYLLKRQIDQLDKTLVEHKAMILLLQGDVQTIRNDYLHKNDFKDFKIELRSMFDELKQDIKSLRQQGHGL
jgi:hypothetical protein